MISRSERPQVDVSRTEEVRTSGGPRRREQVEQDIGFAFQFSRGSISEAAPHAVAAADVRRTSRSRRKATSARRLIDLLSLFNDLGRGATVQEVSARLGWPQSSTSELVALLNELGVLHRDPKTRRHQPTPLAASLGLAAQPPVIRSCRLHNAMDLLARETGCSTALIGKVGLTAQVFGWARGAAGGAVELRTGLKLSLQSSAVGWLLLSTLGQDLWPRVLHRLQAEASPSIKFDLGAVVGAVEDCAVQASVTGPSGFAAGLWACAALAPESADGQPLALAVLTRRRSSSALLLEKLKETLSQ